MTGRRDNEGVQLYGEDDFPSTETAMSSFVSRFLKSRGISMKSAHGEAADAAEDDAKLFKEKVLLVHVLKVN